mgnify:CR=1 FL=1
MLDIPSQIFCFFAFLINLFSQINSINFTFLFFLFKFVQWLWFWFLKYRLSYKLILESISRKSNKNIKWNIQIKLPWRKDERNIIQNFFLTTQSNFVDFMILDFNQLSLKSFLCLILVIKGTFVLFGQSMVVTEYETAFTF